MTMTVLAVILARGGSKRVPGKNLRDLGGTPLVAWSIVAAKAARAIDHVVVSSDDADILRVARSYGADAIERPAHMATDDASSYPALMHAAEAFDPPPEYVCLLQPTSPFRNVYDIAACVWLATGGYPAVVSVAVGERVPNGAIYLGRLDWLRESLARGVTHPFDTAVPFPYAMPVERSLDIDTEDDWAKAEAHVADFMAQHAA